MNPSTPDSSKSSLCFRKRRVRSKLAAKNKCSLLMDPPAFKSASSRNPCRHQSPWLTREISVLRSAVKSMVFDTIIELALQECSAHGQDENVRQPPFTEIGSDDFIPARKPSRKRKDISRSSTFSSGKRRKPCMFHQTRSASFQHSLNPKSKRTASTQFMTRVDGQDVLREWDGGDVADADCQMLASMSKHRQSEYELDNALCVTKQQQQGFLDRYIQAHNETLYTTDPAQTLFVDPSATKEGYGFLQIPDQSLEALRATIGAVHAASSNTCNTPNNEASTISRAQTTTASDGLAAYNGNSVSAQAAASGSGDGADDPNDPNRLRKPLRLHETETSCERTKLGANVGADDDKGTDMQLERDCKSSDGEDCDGTKLGKGRSRSWSNNDNWRTTIGFVQRSESAPAQARGPTRSDEDGAKPEDGSPSNTDDGCLQQALIRRCSMVRASDITGEPTVDAPWVHPMRPTSLLALRRGHEGYGGYGKLPNLPDADRPSTVDNQRIATNTLVKGHNPRVTNHELATDGRSFSFASTGSVTFPHTALTDGPSRELDGADPLQDQSSVTAPTKAGTRLPAHVERCQPRRLSAPRIIPQVLSASVSASGDDLPTYARLQTGMTPHGILTGSRRRQARSWSSVLCCMGDSVYEGRSSSETERSSSETEPPQHSASQSTNQVQGTSGSQVTEVQSNSSGQTFVFTVRHPENHGSTLEHIVAATDRLELPQAITSRDSQSNPTVVMGRKNCFRARFAEKNERWRDPNFREEQPLGGPQPPPPAGGVNGS